MRIPRLLSVLAACCLLVACAAPKPPPPPDLRDDMSTMARACPEPSGRAPAFPAPDRSETLYFSPA